MKKFLALMLAVMMCIAFAGCTVVEEKKSENHYVIATDKGFSPFEFQDKETSLVLIWTSLLQ